MKKLTSFCRSGIFGVPEDGTDLNANDVVAKTDEEKCAHDRLKIWGGDK